jgi:hypothetical protein
MTIFRRLLVLACAACLSLAAHAQQNPLRTLPKDAKSGYLTHVSENAFTLDGRRVLLAPGGIIRGANNLIVTPNMVPRESIVSYQMDTDGQIARAWILTRDEAAKADVGTRFGWQTSPELGTSINQILGTSSQPGAVAQPGERGQAPGFMQQRPAAPDISQPVTGQAQ